MADANGSTPAEIMTPSHPRWREFADRLGGPEACDFRGDDTWRCNSDLRWARALLVEMGCDVEGSVAFFEEHGGHCDCEVLFNVDVDDAA